MDHSGVPDRPDRGDEHIVLAQARARVCSVLSIADMQSIAERECVVLDALCGQVADAGRLDIFGRAMDAVGHERHCPNTLRLASSEVFRIGEIARMVVLRVAPKPECKRRHFDNAPHRHLLALLAEGEFLFPAPLHELHGDLAQVVVDNHMVVFV